MKGCCYWKFIKTKEKRIIVEALLKEVGGEVEVGSNFLQNQVV